GCLAASVRRRRRSADQLVMLDDDLCALDVAIMSLDGLVVLAFQVVLDAFFAVPLRIGYVFAWVLLTAKHLLSHTALLSDHDGRARLLPVALRPGGLP